MKKSKLLWRLLGYVLIPALFFCFGNSLRAQDNTYTRITTAEDLGEGGTFILTSSFTVSGTEYCWAVSSFATKNYPKVDITIENNEITILEASANKPLEVIIEKVTSGKYTLKNSATGKYFSATKGNNGSTEGTTATEFILYVNKGDFHFTLEGASSATGFQAYKSGATEYFQYYKSSQKPIQLYKKQEAASCGQVTGVQTSNITASSVQLDWSAPATAPANGYLVTITPKAGGAAVVTDDAVEAGTTTYTNSGLAESTTYTYSIKSDCGGGSTSEAVTGEFTTLAAAQVSLNVSLSGTKEGDKFTGPVTFTFTPINKTIAVDAKVKYTIMCVSENCEYTDVDDELVAETTLTLPFPVGSYEALFKLVDMEGNNFETPVEEVEKEFTVKLPTVKAPEFSLAEQTAAFTTAQTITLSSATTDATIYYAINDGEFTAYTQAIELNENGTYVIKAYAAKDGMDTSATITKTYKLKIPLHIEGVKVATYDFSNGLATGWAKEGKNDYAQKEANVPACRLGSGNYGATISTTKDALLADFTVYIKAKAFNATENKAKVSVTVGEDTHTETITDLPADEYGEYALPFSFASAKAGNMQIIKDVKITVATYEDAKNNRFFLQTVAIYQATETPEECNEVEGLGDGNQIVGTTANITWQTPDPVPQIGYAIELRTDNEANTLVKKDTIKNTSATSYSLEGLTQGTDYVFAITTLCSAKATSEPAELHFTVPVPGKPALQIMKPAASAEIDRDSVMFIYKVENFALKGEDAQGSVKYTIRGTNLASPVTGTVTDTFFFYKFARSGKDTVVLELVDKTGASLETPVTARRSFTIDLPNVARPVFAPEATTATEAIQVTISCATQGATIYYSLNDAAYQAYTGAISLTDIGTYAFKAFAVKEKMDTSTVATKTYTIKAPYDFEVADLSALRAGTQGKKYKVTGEVILTAKSSNRNYKWIQDGNAGILIDDAKGLVKTAYEVGDGITGVIGELGTYGGQLQLVMIGNLPEASSHNNIITPIELTIPQITTGIDTYCSRVVKLSGLSLVNPALTEGKWDAAKSYTAKDRKGDTVVIYTSIKDGDFVGEDLPQGKFDLVGMAGKYVKNNATQIQLIPRSKADIEEIPACGEVVDLSSDVTGTTVTFSWSAPEPAPEVGYAIEVRTHDVENTLIKQDTVKNPATLSYTLENLTEGEYTYAVTTLCSEEDASEPVSDNFEIVAEGKPSIQIVKPAAGEFTRDSVMFTFKVNNFKLKGEDAEGSVKYTIRGTNLAAPVTATITDTFFYHKFERSGKDTVVLELVGEGLEKPVTARRAFSINLPDVATPVFTPAETSHNNAIDVTISSATEGATVYYSLNGGDFEAYTGAVSLTEAGTYAFKAFAAKAKMDTSKMVSKTYTLKIAKPLEPGVLFYEPFDGFGATATGVLDTKLDDYTELPGWKGEKVYMQVAGIVKMGGSSDSGYLQTPAIALTEGNKYLLSFDAQAWKGDVETLIVTIDGTKHEISGLVNTEDVNGKTPTQMKTFEKEFTATSAATTIRFSSQKKSKSRFLLDNVKVQVDSDEPTFNVVSSLTMNTVLATPVSKTVFVTGRHLAADITVTCPQGNFSVEPATLAKETVMDGGAEFTVTFNGNVVSDSVTITLASGELTKTLKVKATAEAATEVENIAALRAGDLESTTYMVKGQVVVTAVDGISTWVQDATGAIQIYGATGNNYAVGDGITGIFGTLKDYSGLIELIPSGNQPEATSHNNVVEPEVMTIEEFNEAGAEYSSRLIRINGLSLNDPEATDGKWKGGSNYKAADREGNEITIRTTLSKGSYIGEALPEGKFDLISIAGFYNNDVQVSPRVKEDIIAKGGDEDDCEAPTNLMYSGSTKITVKWNGSANEYKLALLSKDGKDTVMTKMLTVTEYTFGDEVKPNVEYGWAVASVCENGKLVWAKGKNFQIETANEEAELQADIYPNPTDGVVYIKLAEAARMEIFTLGGTVLRSEELSAGRNELRLDQSGIYFIRLTNGTAATVRRVVVR